jgi:hypothetical protein
VLLVTLHFSESNKQSNTIRAKKWRISAASERLLLVTQKSRFLRTGGIVRRHVRAQAHIMYEKRSNRVTSNRPKKTADFRDFSGITLLLKLLLSGRYSPPTRRWPSIPQLNASPTGAGAGAK